MKSKWLNKLLLKVVPSFATMYAMILGWNTSLIVEAPSYLKRRKNFLNWKGVIYCSWHSRLFYFVFYGKGTQTINMISASGDGEFIARIVENVRMYAVRGSSSRRGQEVKMETAEYLEKGYRVFMIPDGPRGPKYQAKPGVIRLAQMTGCPIVPISFSSTKGVFLPSWDYFFVPFPGGKGAFTMGDPIWIPSELSSEQFEEKRIFLENKLNELQNMADDICGRDPEKEVLTFLRRKKKKKRKPKENAT